MLSRRAVVALAVAMPAAARLDLASAQDETPTSDAAAAGVSLYRGNRAHGRDAGTRTDWKPGSTLAFRDGRYCDVIARGRERDGLLREF